MAKSKKAENIDRLFLDLERRERIGAALWGVLGGGQIALGILFWWPTIVIGGLNLLAVPSRIKQSFTVRGRPASLLQDYNAWRSRILVNLVLNLALGMGVGLIGSLYDIFLRRFVAMHARELSQGLRPAEEE